MAPFAARSLSLILPLVAAAACVDATASSEPGAIPSAATGDAVSLCDPAAPPLRDLGGYALVWPAATYAIDPPLGNQWTDAVCNTPSHLANATYFPGAAHAGTYLVFKLPRTPQADFARFWNLTAQATIGPDAQLVDRLPYPERDGRSLQLIAGGGGPGGVLETDAVGPLSFPYGNEMGCRVRTSRASSFTTTFQFNATPGAGTSVADGGTPFVTEVCSIRAGDFGFVEVFVP